MALSPKQVRAVLHYQDVYDVKQTMSAYPIIYFKDGDGNERKANIIAITDLYDGWKLQKSREKGRRKT